MWPSLRILAIGAAGAGAALALHVPAPFLTGPAFLVSLAALCGLRGNVPDRLRDGCFVLIGAGMGSGVTPEALATAAQWPLSLVILSLGLMVVFLGGARLLQAIFGMDRMTAILTATPGHMSFVLSLSTELRADLPRVTMTQSLRVLALTLLVPLLAPLLTDRPLPAFAPVSSLMPLPHLALVLALSAVAGLGLQRLRVPAGLLLGGMAVSAAAHAAALTEGVVTPWLAVPGFVVMGTLIGTRLSGVTPSMLGQALGAASLLTGFAALVSLAGAALVAHLFGLPVVTALIAFAPGGLETMLAMSVLLDANPAFVAAHHVFRLLLLTVVLPLVVSRARR